MTMIRLIPNARGDVGFAIERSMLDELDWPIPGNVCLTLSESSPGVLIIEPVHRLVDPPPDAKCNDEEAFPDK